MTDSLTPAGIAEHLVLPYLNHAVRMYESGYASRDDIDAGMRFGCGYPAGPLATVDERGVAAVRDALAARYAESGDHLHQPADLLERLAADGSTLSEDSSGAAPPAPQLRHEIGRVGVVGTGTMASGIAQVFAQSGYDVVYVGRSAEKVAGVATAILATTTSSLPITECAKATSRPENVIGMHFFNPAPVMKLVEVVTTAQTAPEVDETTRALCAEVGKVAVSCSDRSGFIVNALLFPSLNDAVRLHESGVPIETIDEAVKEQLGFPMGPFALLDVVGHDVSLAIQKELYHEFEEPGFEPAALLERVVAEGRLGRKTGKGFHDYSR